MSVFKFTMSTDLHPHSLPSLFLTCLMYANVFIFSPTWLLTMCLEDRARLGRHCDVKDAVYTPWPEEEFWGGEWLLWEAPVRVVVNAVPLDGVVVGKVIVVVVVIMQIVKGTLTYPYLSQILLYSPTLNIVLIINLYSVCKVRLAKGYKKYRKKCSNSDIEIIEKKSSERVSQFSFSKYWWFRLLIVLYEQE